MQDQGLPHNHLSVDMCPQCFQPSLQQEGS